MEIKWNHDDGKWSLIDEDGNVCAIRVTESILRPISIVGGRIQSREERRQTAERWRADVRAELRAEGALPVLRLVK